MGRFASLMGIIPALAGNTISTPGWIRTRSDHPRSRGEYARGAFHRPPQLGSSPLSRGIRGVDTDTAYQVRIIPALAGNTSMLLRP